MLHQATQELFVWIDTLPEQEKNYAIDMHEYISSKGIKPRNAKTGSISFSYWRKGNRVMFLRENYWNKTPLDIAIPYGLKGKNADINSFISICSDEADSRELTNYIINNACYCDRCRKGNEKCGGCWVEFANVRRKIALCHTDITKWKAPKAKTQYTDEDLHCLKRLVDVRINQILQSINPT